MRRLLVVATVVAGLAAVPAFALRAGGAIAPPDATAKCVDGTYSYSLHHSGTCLHRGLYELEPDTFLAALTGHPASHTVLRRLADERVEELRRLREEEQSAAAPASP